MVVVRAAVTAMSPPISPRAVIVPESNAMPLPPMIDTFPPVDAPFTLMTESAASIVRCVVWISTLPPAPADPSARNRPLKLR